MSNEEIARKIHEFSEHLNLAGIFSDMIRWIGWVFAVGLSILVDGLEAVVNEVLLVKSLFGNTEYIEFVNSFRPLFYVLLAVSLITIGYQLMFQKQTNREALVFNFFVAFFIITTLSAATEKINDFTDEVVDTIRVDSLYSGEENGTFGQVILKNNLTDVVLLDKSGWSAAELQTPNTINIEYIRSIDVREKLTTDSDNYDLSDDGKQIAKNKLAWNVDTNEASLIDLDQSGIEWNNEYYYRYSVDWFTLLVTLVVIGFTLFSIAFKLARLSFELVFNQMLATIVAPIDVHDGQKTKKILQDIISIFAVIILIFLSMKIYMIGVGFLEENLTGLAYLIALIGFSWALIDGPNIVERLFGIDAGLKSGWPLLAGIYAGSLATSKAALGIGKKFANKLGNDEKEKGSTGNKDSGASNLGQQSPLANKKHPSPFDDEKNKLASLFDQEEQKDSNEGKNNSTNSDVEGNADKKLNETGKSTSSKQSKSTGDATINSQQSQPEQQTNANDTDNVQQTGNVSIESGVDSTNSGDSSLALQQAAASSVESKQIAGISSVHRQSQAENQINVTDQADIKQNMNTTGEQRITEGGNNSSISPVTEPTSPNNQEAPQVTGTSSIHRQSQVEHQINVRDQADIKQNISASSEQSITVLESNGSISPVEEPTSSNNQEVQQVTGTSSSSVHRQSQVEHQTNVRDQAEVKQNMITSSERSITEGESISSISPVTEPTASSSIHRQSHAEHQTNVIDEINITQTVNTTSVNNVVNSSNSGSISEEVSGTNYGTEEHDVRNISQQKNTQTVVEHIINKEVHVNENTQGTQIANQTSSIERSGEMQETATLPNPSEERTYVINKSSKAERLQRIKQSRKII